MPIIPFPIQKHTVKPRPYTAAVVALIAIATALFAWTVYAQPVDAPAPHTLSGDLAPLLQLGDLAKTGPIAVIVAVLLVVSRLLTRFGTRLPGKVGEWFASPLANWLLPLILSVTGSLFTALAAGAQVTLGLLLGAVLAGLAAGGTGNKQAVIAAAVRSGEVSAAKVETSADAVAALNK